MRTNKVLADQGSSKKQLEDDEKEGNVHRHLQGASLRPCRQGAKSAYVDLPPECGKPGTCGQLQYWLYGMRPASHGWEAEHTRQLEAVGFVAGAASPCCFHRASDHVACVVHGDDFTFEGEPSSLQEVAEALAKVCPLGERPPQVRVRSQARAEVDERLGHGRMQVPHDSRD